VRPHKETNPCPGGTYDRSQPPKAFGAGTGPIENSSRLVIARMAGYNSDTPRWDEKEGSDSTEPKSRCFMPGYHHLVPPGQTHLRPYEDEDAHLAAAVMHAPGSPSSSNLVTYSRKPTELLDAILGIVSSYPPVIIASPCRCLRDSYRHLATCVSVMANPELQNQSYRSLRDGSFLTRPRQ
jgi:hypothetical protein